ncbi:MAG TPA: hypothetical protein VNQ76_17785 [Planctomicrobium sp.]|nr:hypothetical protein [Planctomicrobium sp.]
MSRLPFGFVTAALISVAPTVNGLEANDSPYLPFNSNGTLIVPEETPKPTTVNSPPPTYAPSKPPSTYDYTPSLGPNLNPNNGSGTTPPSLTPNSTIPLHPTPVQPTPAQQNPMQQNPAPQNPGQSNFNQPNPAQPNSGTSQPYPTYRPDSTFSNPAPGSANPTVVTPGMMQEFGPRPYTTNYGPGYPPGLWDYFTAPSWTPRSRPYRTNYGAFGGMGNPCAPCGQMNYEFGRGYDGFMTGW